MECYQMVKMRRMAARYGMTVRKSKSGGYRLFYEDLPVSSVNDKSCATAMTRDEMEKFLSDLRQTKITTFNSVELKGDTANVQ